MFAGGCAIYATGKEIKGGGIPPRTRSRRCVEKDWELGGKIECY
ncbi:hypothetical protein CIP107521_00614 [Corynebacterium diphtheriae]|nr:hypothetical protein CIP107521_00614 [Corynebacterium diphtheriae]